MTHNRFRCLIAFLLAGLGLAYSGASAFTGETGGETGTITILSTTFPIHQITRNVVAGAEGVSAELLLPAAAGCPHDYALTPRDMTKIAEADILVVNGLGMEHFLGAPLARANPDLFVVDSAEGAEDLLGYETLGEPVTIRVDEHGHVHDEHCEHDRDHGAPGFGGEEGGNEHHGHGGEVNPHLFASPAMSAALANTIAEGLAEADPERGEQYRRNAAAYAESMRVLAEEMREAVGLLANNRIVEPHGAFDYLARDVGLDVVAVLQTHGEELSPARLTALAEEIRDAGAGAIVVEPEYSSRTGEMLARETGVPVIVLDPGAAGPDDAPPDHYETVMRRNIEALNATLGGR